MANRRHRERPGVKRSGRRLRRANLQDIQLEIQVESPDGAAAVERLAAEWKERCPIYLALIKPMTVAVSVSNK